MNLNIDTALETLASIDPVKVSAKVLEFKTRTRTDDSANADRTLSESFNQEIDDWARRACHTNGFGWY